MQSNSFVWSRNIRIVAFVLVMLFIEVWKWGWRMSIQAHQRKYILAAYAYVLCFITSSKYKMHCICTFTSYTQQQQHTTSHTNTHTHSRTRAYLYIYSPSRTDFAHIFAFQYYSSLRTRSNCQPDNNAVLFLFLLLPLHCRVASLLLQLEFVQSLAVCEHFFSTFLFFVFYLFLRAGIFA